MYMTCKHYLELVLGFGKIKIGVLGGKRVWNLKVFLRTDERSLKRAISELQASVPSRFWT